MSSGGWDVALDAMNDLSASFRTERGLRYMTAYAESLTDLGKVQVLNKDGVLRDARQEQSSAEQMVINAMRTVDQGDPMWVAEEVLDLAEFAAETWQSEGIYPDDMTIPRAFACMERPLVMIDRHGKRCPYRALSWAPCQYGDNKGKTGIVVAHWAHRDDDKLGDYGDDLRRLPLTAGSPFTLQHIGSIAYGDAETMREPTQRLIFTQLQVLQRLAKQEIAIPARHQVSRPVWRRKSNWRQIKTVQVLTLRRAKHPHREEGDREVEWTHRWWVNGHWRNQWYPKQQRHYQIWIDGFVKGPDDRPFVAKRHAIEFTR